MKFRPEIEGLRTVAILPVVLYHANHALAPGGYVGVDIFFVISGFLITQIIAEAVSDNNFSYVSFYHRRIRRIFPALYFMLAVVSPLAVWVLSPSAIQEFGRTLLAVIFFVSNIEFLHLSGYFGGAAELKPLLHTWSLAVEEQFYIVFPILLIGLHRWARRHIKTCLVLCGLVSLAVSIALVEMHPRQAFFAGAPRAFELLIGSLLALSAIKVPSDSRWREALAIAGLALIVIAIVAFDGSTSFPGLMALIPCLGAAAIILAGGATMVGKALSTAPMRFIGRISYSLYLWHWPLLALTRSYYFGAPPLSMQFLAVFAAVGMAIVSRYAVEQPFLREGKVPVFRAAGMAAAIGLIAGGLLSSREMLAWRFPSEAQRFFAAAQDYNKRRSTCLGGSEHWISYEGNCSYGSGAGKNGIVVWSDSHGAELVAALGKLAGSQVPVMGVTWAACPPSLNYALAENSNCEAHNSETLAKLTVDQRFHTVVLLARYDAYTRPERFWQGYEKVVSALSKAGKRVILIYPMPEFSSSPPEVLGVLAARGLAPESFAVSWREYIDRNSKNIATLDSLRARYGTGFVRPDRLFCNALRCPAYNGRTIVYFDDNHPSLSGVRPIAWEVLAQAGINGRSSPVQAPR
jgi:peptidoglycan/LPS O-acetylase OafA/YrhL